MASFTLTRPDRFPDGTTVNAYAVSNWPAGVNQAAAPTGSSAASGTVSGGSVTFTGVTAGTRYVAYAQVSSQHRYVDFVAGADAKELQSQSADAVTITGGSITGITDLAVADGGTGASTAAGARTALTAAKALAPADMNVTAFTPPAVVTSTTATGSQNSTGVAIQLIIRGGVISDPADNGHIYLEIAATNSTTASDWKQVGGYIACRNTAAGGEIGAGGTLQAVVPAGWYYRVRTQIIANTPTFVYDAPNAGNFYPAGGWQ